MMREWHAPRRTGGAWNQGPGTGSTLAQRDREFLDWSHDSMRARAAMTTEDDVRRLALGLPEVTERPAWGSPAFYVRGKILARVHEAPGILVCWRSSLEEREVLLEAEPEKFFTTDHYRDHTSVLVRLDHVEADELAELLLEAWESRAPKRLRDRGGS